MSRVIIKHRKGSVSAFMDNLQGDCSSYSVGRVGMSAPSDTLEEWTNNSKLLAHAWWCSVLRTKVKWNTLAKEHMNKFVFTNEPRLFDSDSFGVLYQVGKLLAQKEHTVGVNGWQGDQFQIRVLEINKNVDLIPDLQELDFEKAEVTVKMVNTPHPYSETFRAFPLKYTKEFIIKNGVFPK